MLVPSQKAGAIGATGATGATGSGIPSFDVALDYGGKFDGVQLHNGAITSGLKAFSSSTAVFTSADIGKYIMVHGAGTSGAALITTIAAYVSPTAVTTTAAAGTTVTGAETYYASDDTAAWQNAINAALTASQTLGSTKPAVITFPDGISGIAGALQDTSWSNAQLYFPTAYLSDTSIGVIEFRGRTKPSSVQNDIGVLALKTPAIGTVLLSFLNSGSGGALFRPKATGTTYGHIYLCQVNFYNLTVRMPPNPMLSGLDLYWVCAAEFDNVTVDAGNQNIPSNVDQTTTTSYGIRTPQISSGAYVHFDTNVNVFGFYNGIEFNEHSTGDVICVMACKYPATMAAMNHAALIGRLMILGCPHHIRITGTCYFQILQLDIEVHKAATWGGPTATPTWHEPVEMVLDATNLGKGDITWLTVEGYVGYSTLFTKTGGTGIRCKHLATGTVT